ncbi:MAG: hypothetical protein GX238_00080 [Epulopiscium sp.]|nr:hypothetical protein [Candidatus Epulonipiscium sp.]
MTKGYVLFIILNHVKDVKRVMSILKKYGAQATMMDTLGAASLYEKQEAYDTMIAGRRQSLGQGKKYNKTIFTVLSTEEAVVKIMDEVEEYLGITPDSLGRGFLFTIPMYTFRGIQK